jgi:hypothetical protein
MAQCNINRVRARRFATGAGFLSFSRGYEAFWRVVTHGFQNGLGNGVLAAATLSDPLLDSTWLSRLRGAIPELYQ